MTKEEYLAAGSHHKTIYNFWVRVVGHHRKLKLVSIQRMDTMERINVTEKEFFQLIGEENV